MRLPVATTDRDDEPGDDAWMTFPTPMHEPGPRRAGHCGLVPALACLVVALCAVAGCDPTGPEIERRIEVRTDLESYQVGQDALLTITNRTGREIAYDFCTVTVERKIDGEWEPWGTFGFCLYPGDFLPTLAPGAHAMRNLPVGVPFEGSSSSQPILDSPLEAGGEYRVLVEVEGTPGDFGTRTRIGSNAFVVDPAGGTLEGPPDTALVPGGVVQGGPRPHLVLVRLVQDGVMPAAATGEPAAGRS